MTREIKKVRDVVIPSDLSVVDFVFQKAKKTDKVAVVDGLTGDTFSYKQLYRYIQAFSGHLLHLGLRKGDVLAIYSPNSIHYPIIFYGALNVGVIVTTINYVYNEKELEYQLDNSKAKLVVTIPSLSKTVAAVQTKCQSLKIVMHPDVISTLKLNKSTIRAIKSARKEINPQNDIAVLPYSSGTTGLPKGVELTHYNIVANLCQNLGMNDIHADSVTLVVLPLYHIYGMTMLMGVNLSAGATIVILPRFELEVFCKAIQEHQISALFIVPPILLQLAKNEVVSKYDLSSLKFILCGAAPLPSELGRECSQKFNVVVKQAYGMTELSPLSHYAPNDPNIPVKVDSIGHAVANSISKILDPETGKELPTGEVGEICVQGPQVMRGYWNNEEATKAMIDKDGFLHTGDLGYVDAEGYFFVVDRLKELIKSKGFQVAPAELEALLQTHPKVLDCAVVPYPDRESGEVPKAFIVKRDSSLTEDEIIAWIAEHVSTFKRIKIVEFIQEIPKSPSGKILRRILVSKDKDAVSRAGKIQAKL